MHAPWLLATRFLIRPTGTGITNQALRLPHTHASHTHLKGSCWSSTTYVVQNPTARKVTKALPRVGARNAYAHAQAGASSLPYYYTTCRACSWPLCPGLNQCTGSQCQCQRQSNCEGCTPCSKHCCATEQSRAYIVTVAACGLPYLLTSGSTIACPAACLAR